MTFDDLYNKVEEAYLNSAIKHSDDYAKMGEIDDLEASDAEKMRQALEYISNSESAREIFQNDADIMKELRTQIKNEYNDEDIIKALKLGGEDKTPDLYSYEKGWMSIPTKEFVKMARDAGLEPKELIRYLGDKQRDRDRKLIVEGYDPYTGKANTGDWIASALYGLAAPRSKEAHKRGETPSGKDIALDIAELGVSSIPVGGPTSAIASKVLGKGAKGVASGLGHWATKQGKTVVDASIAPLLMEVADAAAYDDVTNPRSTFNPYDVGVGTLTNAAAPWLLRSGLGMFARPVGSRSGLAKAVENLTDDPTTRALYNLESAMTMLKDAKNRANKYTAEELSAARDIVMSSELLKDNPKLAAYAEYLTGESILTPRTVKKAREAVKTKYNEDLAADKPVEASREAQKKAAKSDILPEQEAFEEAGGNVYATDFLENDDWGLTKAGKLGKMNVEQGMNLDIGPNNKIDPRHAVSSAQELRAEAKGKASHDKYYPRPSDFDVEVDRLIRTNPEQFKAGSGLTSGLRSLTTNKLAPTWSKRIVATYPSLDLINREPDENKVAIQNYLNNSAIIRMWDDGKFKPREIEGDPLWEAYKIYKQTKGE